VNFGRIFLNFEFSNEIFRKIPKFFFPVTSENEIFRRISPKFQTLDSSTLGSSRSHHVTFFCFKKKPHNRSSKLHTHVSKLPQACEKKNQQRKWSIKAHKKSRGGILLNEAPKKIK